MTLAKLRHMQISTIRRHKIIVFKKDVTVCQNSLRGTERLITGYRFRTGVRPFC
jgi:hypothetical protein